MTSAGKRAKEAIKIDKLVKTSPVSAPEALETFHYPAQVVVAQTHASVTSSTRSGSDNNVTVDSPLVQDLREEEDEQVLQVLDETSPLELRKVEVPRVRELQSTDGGEIPSQTTQVPQELVRPKLRYR